MSRKLHGKRWIIIASMLALSLVLSVVSYAMVKGKDKLQPDREKEKYVPVYVPGEILVKFREGADLKAVLKAVKLKAEKIKRIYSITPVAAKYKKRHKLPKDKTEKGIFREAYKEMSSIEKSLYRSYNIRLPKGMGVEEAVYQLGTHPDVEYAEPNYIYQMDAISLPSLVNHPDDTYYTSDSINWREGAWGNDYPDMWPLEMIKALEAQEEIENPNTDIVVAVIDSGTDRHHPDFYNPTTGQSNIWINSGEDADGDGIIEGERFEDTGADGLYNNEEPEFHYEDNPDPNNDDYDSITNPEGTEGNHIYDIDEPFHDHGLDGIGPNSIYYTGPDTGEGNGVYDEGDFDNIDNDGNGYVDDVYGYSFASIVFGCMGLYRYVPQHSFPIDTIGHGTHVAGTIAACKDNAEGIIGVAPNAKIMTLNIFSTPWFEWEIRQSGRRPYAGGAVTDIVEAFYYAAAEEARVISCSFSGRKSRTMDDIVRFAHEEGSIIVVSAGNANNDTFYYSPTSTPEAITVASLDHLGNKSDFSNCGSAIDVAAPGGDSGDELHTMNILSLRAEGTHMYATTSYLPLIIDDIYYCSRGTSMACPHVSGLCALLLSKNPSLTNEQVRWILRESGDDLGEPGWDEYTGYGRINAMRAVSLDAPTVAGMIWFPAQGEFVAHETIDIIGYAEGSSYEVIVREERTSRETLLENNYLSPPGTSERFILAQWTPGPDDEWEYYTITLRVTTGAESVEHSVKIKMMNTLDGWPKMVPCPMEEVVVGDIDGDGENEIVSIGRTSSFPRGLSYLHNSF